jgi:transposase-like protein
MVTNKKPSDQAANANVEGAEGVTRGRPGRRSAAERTQAVMELLAGKASADQLGKRYGVLPATVTGWRDEAIGGMESALRHGDGGSPRERELERRVLELEETLKDVSLKYALASRGVEAWKATARPTQRRRSSK